MGSLKLLLYQLRIKKKSLIFFSIGLFLYGFLITAIYPTVSGIEAFSQYWRDFPESFKNLFGGPEINILTPEGFITLEYYQLIMVIILAAFVIGFAAFAVARSREDGTIELILTHPMERWRYALTSFFSLAIGLAVLCFVSIGTVMLIAVFFGVDLSLLGQVKLFFLLYLLLGALGSISLFASCALDRGGQVYAVGITVLAVSYLVNFLSNNWAFFRFIDHALLYHYYDSYGVMVNAGFPWSSLLYYGAIIVLFTALSLLTLQRRDITI